MFTTRITTLQVLVEACRPGCAAKDDEQLATAYKDWAALAASAHQMARKLEEFEGTGGLWNEDEHESVHPWGDSSALISFRTCDLWCEADTVLVNGNWIEVDANVPSSIAYDWNCAESRKHQEEQAQNEYEAKQVTA